MTAHQDVAGVVAECLRPDGIMPVNSETTRQLTQAVISLSKALSEAEVRCVKLVRDVICTIDWPPTDGDALIDALQSAIRTGKVS